MTRSVSDIFATLLSTARSRTRSLETQPDDEGMITMSVRVPRRLKLEYDELAGNLRLSSNALMVSVLAGAMTAELDPIRTEANAISARWLQLHRDHGLTLPQIVQLHGGGLTLAILADDQQLLAYLTTARLARTAQIFNVRQPWLESGASHVFETKNQWYSGSVGFAQRLAGHVEAGYRPRVLFLRSRAGRFEQGAEDRFDDNDKLALLLAVRVKVEGVEFVRYEWWGAERWTYERAQAEMCALIELVTNPESRLMVSGYALEPGTFAGLIRGTRHPSEVTQQLGWSSTFNPEWLAQTAQYRAYADEYTSKLNQYRAVLEQGGSGIDVPEGVPRDR